MAKLGKPETIVPIVPRTEIELASFGVSQDFAKVVFARRLAHSDNIFPVPKIHDLRDHATGVHHGFFRGLPPHIACCKRKKAGAGVRRQSGIETGWLNDWHTSAPYL